MVRAMLAGRQPLRSTAIEIDRAGLSFTVETLERARATHPGAELFFLVGADVLGASRSGGTGRVLRLAQLVVLTRAGGAGESAAADGGVAMRARPGTEAPLVLETSRVDVSSTEVRGAGARPGGRFADSFRKPSPLTSSAAGLYR